MDWNFIFFANSALLGIGLAMDAFSVSIVNALSEPNMKPQRQCLIAGVYAFFQFMMPMIGWLCVHWVAETFKAFQKFIPWIALILLLFIGVKMIVESIQSKEKNCGETQNESAHSLAFGALLIQGIATSIDALSVGFTIAEYGLCMAIVASLIIAAVTFGICMTGLLIGKAASQKLSSRAQILGGTILIFIGLEIFARGVFFN